MNKKFKSNKIRILKNLFILSGPSFADEVILNKPTALSLAGKGQHEIIGKLFQNSNLRLYYSNHIKTLEFLGILKNIYALGAGIIDALSLGENAKASFLTRCLYEIKSTLKLKKLDQQQLFSFFSRSSSIFFEVGFLFFFGHLQFFVGSFLCLFLLTFFINMYFRLYYNCKLIVENI